MTATVLRKTVQLHKAQADFRRSQALYRGFVGGRNSGKTWAGAYDLIRRAKRGRTYLAASPTYTVLADVTLPTVEKIARELGVWTRLNHTPRPWIKLSTGATIRFRSAEDPEMMRGPNLSGVWLDEASLMIRAAFDVCIACLREEGEQGWLSATFTPQGLTHWTYELFGRAGPNTELFHASTRDNPFGPPGFHEQIAQQYSGLRAAQELEGRFVAVEGAEWPAEWFDRADLYFDAWPSDTLTVKVLALDPSKGRSDKTDDYGAWVLYARDVRGGEWVEADLRHAGAEELVATGVEYVRRFAPDALALEVNAFQHLFAPLLRAAAAREKVILPHIYPLNNVVPKVVRIRRLTEPLHQRRLRVRDTPGGRLLVAQLRDFPCGEHDDGPDCLEMARRTAIELYNGRQRRRP